jgi:hypothetical protein
MLTDIVGYTKAARQGHAGAQSNLEVLTASQNDWGQWIIIGIIFLAIAAMAGLLTFL